MSSRLTFEESTCCTGVHFNWALAGLSLSDSAHRIGHAPRCPRPPGGSSRLPSRGPTWSGCPWGNPGPERRRGRAEGLGGTEPSRPCSLGLVPTPRLAGQPQPQPGQCPGHLPARAAQGSTEQGAEDETDAEAQAQPAQRRGPLLRCGQVCDDHLGSWRVGRELSGADPSWSPGHASPLHPAPYRPRPDAPSLLGPAPSLSPPTSPAAPRLVPRPRAPHPLLPEPWRHSLSRTSPLHPRPGPLGMASAPPPAQATPTRSPAPPPLTVQPWTPATGTCCRGRPTWQRVHECTRQARGEEQGHARQGRDAGGCEEQVEGGRGQEGQREGCPRPMLVCEPGRPTPMTLTGRRQGCPSSAPHPPLRTARELGRREVQVLCGCRRARVPASLLMGPVSPPFPCGSLQ